MGWLQAQRALVAILVGLGTCLPVVADDDGPAIPPGQEELLLTMLGKGTTLPDGCALSDGKVERTVIRATYSCAPGEVVVVLSHPERAAANATETERFALAVDSGSPPESLLDALAANVRAHEGEFEWVKPAEVEMPAIDGAIGDRLAPGEPRD